MEPLGLVFWIFIMHIFAITKSHFEIYFQNMKYT